MKKAVYILFLFVCCLGIVGCGGASNSSELENETSAFDNPSLPEYESNTVTIKNNLLLPDGDIKSIAITSMPIGYDLHYTSYDEINKIVEFFNNLNLTEDFEEDPHDLYGCTYIVEFKYADGTNHTIDNAGDLFMLREDDGKWFKTDYEESWYFEDLLKE